MIWLKLADKFVYKTKYMWYNITMNLFILNNDPVIAAQEQCDKHVVKMIVESAQMLSTVHRMLDGVKEKRLSKSGKRMVDYYRLGLPMLFYSLSTPLRLAKKSYQYLQKLWAEYNSS